MRFGEDLSKIVLLPVPCSTEERYNYRWDRVAQNICDVIANHTESDSPINGFLRVKYKKAGSQTS